MKAMVAIMAIIGTVSNGASDDMDSMWGESAVKACVKDSGPLELFADGNYAMFIHWGVYSQLANKVDGKTYYGVGEWIMHKTMADIPVDRYKELAKTFNPTQFDAMAIAQLAKDAGMKYIIITSKHHDGFAMYHSKANSFNIIDATPFDRDPMKELAEACQKVGIGFGFYYSHWQDWTYPGGGWGPQADLEGNPATFDEYYQKKCLPQVKEITSEYGPIVLVWFDTPGTIPKEYAQQLIEVVRENQPAALVSGRVGYGMGDYQSLGDMEIPHQNAEGLWETVDTTNDSWGFAWYDENWKTPKTIVENLISCVARGGTYMLNIGPRGDGTVPQRAADSLRTSGEWIKRYPQVVYGTDASPWQHALAWGDVTVQDNRLYLSVFQWPAGGALYLPGLKTEIEKVTLLSGKGGKKLKHEKVDGWVKINIPDRAPEMYVSVIELELSGPPQVDTCWGIDPVLETVILAEFATVHDATLASKRWMEKYGEWKHVVQATEWQPEGTAAWDVEVLVPGDYSIGLTYAGQGRLVWQVGIENGEVIRNQQNSSHNYQQFPIGHLNFPKPGRYNISVSCLEGDLKTASLKAIHFTPIF
jgi:alpha-L-fucosidase